MVPTKYISVNGVIPDMKATNKSDALKELTYLLFENKKMKDPGPAMAQIMAREVTESTGIGRGIAVPHARIPGMKGLACALGRIHDGLDFTAVDRKPVSLIFLICYPPTDQTIYLNFVATIAKLLSDPEHLRGIMAAKTAEQMLKLLDGASENFTATHEMISKKLETDPEIGKLGDAQADLILLARLQLCQEMLAAAKSGKGQIRQRIEHIRSLVAPRILSHYDRLCQGRLPALVPVEGDTCQGCFMKLPSMFVQRVRQDPGHIHTCSNCSRYIYVV